MWCGKGKTESLIGPFFTTKIDFTIFKIFNTETKAIKVTAKTMDQKKMST